MKEIEEKGKEIRQLRLALREKENKIKETTEIVITKENLIAKMNKKISDLGVMDSNPEQNNR